MKTLMNKIRNFRAILFFGCLTAAMAGCIGQQVPRTKLTVTFPNGGSMTLDNPKDTTFQSAKASVSTNGTAVVEITGLSTAMNPQVISETATGEVNEITARGQAAVNLTGALGTAVGQGVGAAAKTAVKP